ncbi:MAG: hypothetical protein Q8N69_01075 [bacterium]|nr:hypothetical protein [bacterium]
MFSIWSDFIVWYYFKMTVSIAAGWRNCFLFALDYFSLPTLLRTYFSHWHKYQSSYGRVFEIWKNIETLVFNLMSRIIGAIIRTFLILAGIVLGVFVFIAGLALILFWIILPVLIIAGFLFGLWLIFPRS